MNKHYEIEIQPNENKTKNTRICHSIGSHRNQIIFLIILFVKCSIIVAYFGDGLKAITDYDFLQFLTKSNEISTNLTIDVSSPILDPVSNGTLGQIGYVAPNKDLLPILYMATNENQDSPDSPCGYLVQSQLVGRLGNQLFQYASFYGIVKKQEKNANKTAFLWHPSNAQFKMLLNDIFENLTYHGRDLPQSWFSERGFVGQGEKKVYYYDKTGIDNLACDGKNLILRGFRCSFKYFEDSMDEIRKEFTFKSTIRQKCTTLFRDSLTEDGSDKRSCVKIGVHSRRGDFLKKIEIDLGRLPAKEDYVHRAIRFYEEYYFGKIHDNRTCLVFLIFGNDFEWNLKIAGEVELIRPNNSHLIVIDTRKSEPAVDMCTMSLCDHTITSTGTFSWWAGFMTGGMVTYQKEYAKPGTSLYSQYEIEDFMFPDWIPL